MVFRKENKVDAFQRQISALRQQLGGPGEHEGEETDYVPPAEGRYAEGHEERYGGDAPTGPSAYAAPDPGAGATPYGGATYAPAPSDPAMATDPPPYVVPAADEQTSVVAYDTVWKGDLESQGTVHVHGRLEGSLKAKLDIFVAEEADVDATVTATNVVVAGLVRGTIRCGARFEVLSTGRVLGDVQSPTLVVHDGATVSGQLRMGAPEETETRPTAVVQRRAARGGA